MSKFFNWPIPLKNIQCLVKNANVILLSILPLNKASIPEIIDILHSFVKHLGFLGIVEDIVVLDKGDYLTIQNVTCIIYQKQNKLDKHYRFS